MIAGGTIKQIKFEAQAHGVDDFQVKIDALLN
jgi:hypothetical protein